MEEKSLHLLTLERLQSALDNFDTSFIVSNRLFRLALISEILDTACLFEQLYNAWSEKLPFGEGPDADVDFEYWKSINPWSNLINNAQQNICINDATYALGNGMTSDDVSDNIRKNFKKSLTAALKHANFNDGKVVVDFLKWIGEEKSSSLTYGNILFGALQSLLSILNKTNNLLKNPSPELLKNYSTQQKDRFFQDVKDAREHIRQICHTNYYNKRKQNQLRDYEDTLKETLVKSGFLDDFGGEFTKYDIQDFRDQSTDTNITDEEIRNELIISDLIHDYHSGNHARLNSHLFSNRKILSKETIRAFFVFVELYPELRTRIAELGPVQEASAEHLQNDDMAEAIREHTAAIREHSDILRGVASTPIGAGETNTSRDYQNRLINATSDFNEKPSTPSAFPQELSTTEARRLLDLAKSEGWLDEGYKPQGLIKARMALLAGHISDLLWGENKWVVFEQFWGQRTLASSYQDGLTSRNQQDFWNRVIDVIK